MTNQKTRICLIQPVQSPYWSERLRVLADSEDLDVVLLLERGSLSHRPGWGVEKIANVKTGVLGSHLMKFKRECSDLGYRIQSVRGIPLRLPIALWRHRPDIVVVCNATQMLIALMVRPLLGFKLTLIVEDTPHATRNLSKGLHLIRAWVYRRADRYFPFSEDAIEYLRSIGIVDRLSRSSWSLDMERFGKQTEGPLETQETRVEISFVGQFIQLKGVEKLIEAWAELPQETHERVRLSMYGTGPLRDKVMSRSNALGLTNVTFPGHAPYEEIIKALNESHLFILPTLQDLFSLTVLEAMASSCPVITTPFNGARELIEEGRTGWIVDPTEPGALVAVLNKALGPEIDLAAMGRAARQRVFEFDNKKVMKHFKEVLLALSDGTRVAEAGNSKTT